MSFNFPFFSHILLYLTFIVNLLDFVHNTVSSFFLYSVFTLSLYTLHIILLHVSLIVPCYPSYAIPSFRISSFHILLPDHTMGRHSILQYRDIHVGMVSNDSSAYPSPHASGTPGPIPPFIGQMQSLYINGKYVFEMARAGHLNRMEVSGRLFFDRILLFPFFTLLLVMIDEFNLVFEFHFNV